MTNDFLKKHAEELQRVARRTSERAAQDPANFWLSATAENQRQAAGEANQQLELRRADHASELIDLRFVGPRADGAIPLDVFLKIAEPLSKAWKAAAYRLRHGLAEGRPGTEIAEVLNLKLAGMAPGSTHIYITGNANEDTTGESLLRHTLMQTFRMLTAANDDFYDAVDAVGGRAARLFHEAIRAIAAADLSAEFSWNSGMHIHRWQGTIAELNRLDTLLDAVTESDSYDEIIEGVVSGIFETGRLDIRTEQGRIRVRFSEDQTPEVQNLAIATKTILQVRTTRYTDPVTHKNIFKRQLLQRKDLGLMAE